MIKKFIQIMKTFFFSLLATFMFSFVGKAQDDQKIVSIVSLEEYVKMDLVDQKLVNYLDCAISALKGLHLTGSKNYSKYQASIGIN